MATDTPPPPLDAAAAALEAAKHEQAYWEANADTLARQYPDQFVAVHDGKVIAHAPDLMELHEQVRSRGLDIQATWVRFLASDPRRFIL